MKFPKRVYTIEEVKKARDAIENGHKHRLTVRGKREFKQKVKAALKLVKAAKYYDFVRTYIRGIQEIDGISQLREAEAAIWANNYVVADPLDAASFIVQKTQQMKDYIEGRLYYEMGEKRAVDKRIEFLKILEKRSRDQTIKERCQEILKRWTEVPFP
ncbi:MAG: hypothetical protein ACETV1_05925 [Candidatus Bathyarchaeia archaeon]